MIYLHKLNGSEIVVNAEKILFIEKAPDTILSLINGAKLMVKDSPDEIIAKVVEYKRKICQQQEQLVHN